MSITVGFGISKQADAYKAGREATLMAYHQVMQDVMDLNFVFASVKYDQKQLLEGVKSICAPGTIVGCSDAGEISSLGPSQNSVVVLGIKSKNLRFSVGIGEEITKDARTAAQHAAHQASRNANWQRSLFLNFCDGLAVNATELIRGTQEVLGTSLPIVGGSAGDDFYFKKTYQYYNEEIFTQAIVGILLGGKIKIGLGSRHGWRAIGKTHRVTKAVGNVVQEIDGMPAIKFYEDYFGKEAEDLKTQSLCTMAMLYPLGMTINGEKSLIRYALRSTDKGELICGGEIPQDSEVKLMIGDKTNALEAAKEAASVAVNKVGKPAVKAALIFSSIARKRILGSAANKEIEIVRSIIGENAPLAGMYTYGEQASFGEGTYAGKTYFHNASITIVVIGG